jgi:hypothetical protein
MMHLSLPQLKLQAGPSKQDALKQQQLDALQGSLSQVVAELDLRTKELKQLKKATDGDLSVLRSELGSAFSHEEGTRAALVAELRLCEDALVAASAKHERESAEMGALLGTLEQTWVEQVRAPRGGGPSARHLPTACCPCCCLTL